VQLSVSLLDATGEVIAEESGSALMSNLLPGEASPFSVSFEGAAAPAGSRVETLRQEPANGLTLDDSQADDQQADDQRADGPQADDRRAEGRQADDQRADGPQSDDSLAEGRQADDQQADGRPANHRPELVSELEEFFVTGSGELAIMGFITNPGNRHIALDSLGFLGRSPNDREISLAVMQFGPNQLAPGETAPFLALAPENPGAVQWIPFHDGLIAEPPSPRSLEIREAPKLHLTAQGAPFVVGTLVNSGDAASGSVLISLFKGNRLIGLLELETPRPLETGEQLPFVAFGFPGVSLRFDPSDPNAIRVEARVEESAADRTQTLIDLPVDVSAFLSVGSAIFIRGTIRNPMDFDVYAATIYAEVRSSTGELVTAGWSVPKALEPGSSVEFVLDLPIPVGMDATLTEYDLRAIGLKAHP
ncbi:MAG: hypothetical protein V3U32_04510, partial [Anaerolineales bacterium]